MLNKRRRWKLIVTLLVVLLSVISVAVFADDGGSAESTSRF